MPTTFILPMMKKVLVIVGTRPEAIKLFPVFKALRKYNRTHETLLLTTGQHGAIMIDPLFHFFDLKADIALGLSNPSLNEFSGNLLLSMDKILKERKIDMVVVQGDTTSGIVASLASFYRGVNLAHVEAGLRTFNRNSPYPEEVNRRIISLMATIHFSPTETAKKNLITERVEGHVEVVGNTVVDSLLDACERIEKNRQKYLAKFAFLKGRFQRTVLITAHRRENIGSNFSEIHNAIRALAEKYPAILFVFIHHLNPAVRDAAKRLNGVINLLVLEPLPYDEMVFLMKESDIVMTDSGGLQEECPSLGKPVLVLRDTTERPEGIEAGCCVLAGTREEQIVSSFDRIATNQYIYESMASAKNPYGDGDSSKKIAAIIESFFLRNEPSTFVMK